MPFPPLYSASRRGDLKEVNRLLSQGEDINCRGKCMWTPLHAAINNHHTDVALYLISKTDCDIKAKDMWSCTPLHWVCEKNNMTVIKALLERDPDIINECNKDRDTGLHWAAQDCHTDIVEYLCLNYADIVRNKYHKTALDVAKEENHVAVVNILQNYLNNTITDRETPEENLKQQLCSLNNKIEVNVEMLKQEIAQIKEQQKVTLERLSYLEHSKLQQQDIADLKDQQISIINRIDQLEGSLSTARRTLDDVVSPAFCQEQRDLNDAHLLTIARGLGAEWLEIVVMLGVPLEFAQRMLHNHWKNCLMACLNTLISWRDGAPGSVDDKRQVLKQVLESNNKRNIAAIV